jgi:hypothetical protein
MPLVTAKGPVLVDLDDLKRIGPDEVWNHAVYRTWMSCVQVEPGGTPPLD